MESGLRQLHPLRWVLQEPDVQRLAVVQGVGYYSDADPPLDVTVQRQGT